MGELFQKANALTHCTDVSKCKGNKTIYESPMRLSASQIFVRHSR